MVNVSSDDQLMNWIQQQQPIGRIDSDNDMVQSTEDVHAELDRLKVQVTSQEGEIHSLRKSIVDIQRQMSHQAATTTFPITSVSETRKRPFKFQLPSFNSYGSFFDDDDSNTVTYEPGMQGQKAKSSRCVVM